MSTVVHADLFKLAESQRELELLKKRIAIRKAYGLAFYVPHYKQHLFHIANKIRRFVRTGNRFGKSDMGAAEDVAWAVGKRLWYENSFDILDGAGKVREKHIGKKNHPYCYVGIPRRPTKGLILVADWDKSKEIFTETDEGAGTGKLFRLLPKDAIVRVQRNHSGKIDQIIVKSIWGGNSTIHIDTLSSFKSNPLGSESSNWDWIHVDEPIEESMWKAHSRGLVDTHGSAWFCCTPLNEPWINDYFIPTKRGRFSKLDQQEENIFGTRSIIVGTMRDNPFLTEDAIAEFESSLTAEERQCRIEGIPMSQSGMVYKHFDFQTHVYSELPKGWKSFDSPPADYCIRISIDPHPQTPHAVLFAATSPLGQTFFYHEYFHHCLIKELCDKINFLTTNRYVEKILCDPIAWITHPITGECMADDFYRHGVIVERASKELSRGILSVQANLRKEDNWYFSEECSQTLWEFQHYAWNPKKPNVPNDKNDHFMECLYRLSIDGLDYIAPPTGGAEIIAPLDISHVSLNLGRVDYLPTTSSRKSDNSWRYR